MSTQFDASQVSQLSSTFIGVGRNRILNGAMDIDQANAGNSLLISTGGTQYTLDMWASLGGGGQFTVQRQTATPPAGFQKYMRHTVTTADAAPSAASYYFTQQLIEGYNTRDWGFGAAGAKTITVSFWVRSSLTGTFGAAVLNGNDSRAYTFSYTINSANTWEYKIATAIGDVSGTWTSLTTSPNAKLVFDLGTGSNRQIAAGSWQTGQYFTPPSMTKLISTLSATLDITGVQLELGVAATPFEFKPFPIEIQLCQRYYEKSYELDTAPGSVTSTSADWLYGAIYGATSSRLTGRFKIQKRSNPNMIFYLTTGTTGSWTFRSSTDVGTNRTVTLNDINTSNFQIIQTTGTETNGFGQWTADARL